jgi:hypothetical protein
VSPEVNRPFSTSPSSRPQRNEIAGGNAQDFAQLIVAEKPRWATVVKNAKVAPE